MQPTALELLNEGFAEIGVFDPGEALSAEEASFGLGKLNGLIDAWVLDGTLAYTATETVVALPEGTVSLTIGPGADIDLVRPVRIEDSSFVRVDGTDYSLTPLSRTGYDEIERKDFGSLRPRYCWLDGDAPVSKVYFWPQGAAEIHLVTRRQFTPYATVSSRQELPPGYRDAITLTVAERLSMPYTKLGPPPDLVRRAAAARKLVALGNHETPRVSIGAFGNRYVGHWGRW